MSHNDYSVSTGGGDITGGAIAPGGTANYHAVPVSSDALELQRRIEELQRLVAQYAAHLPDAAQLRDDAEELGAQMERERPNRTVVRSLLDSLTTGAGAVDAVLSAVRGLAAFVAPLL